VLREYHGVTLPAAATTTRVIILLLSQPTSAPFDTCIRGTAGAAAPGSSSLAAHKISGGFNTL
jgi:hypothetical protein